MSEIKIEVKNNSNKDQRLRFDQIIKRWSLANFLLISYSDTRSNTFGGSFVFTRGTERGICMLILRIKIPT